MLRRSFLRVRAWIGKLLWPLRIIDPAHWRAVGWSARNREASVQLVNVYRRRNATRVEAVVREAVELGWSVHLWALDEPVPALERWTVGAGPGDRSQLLNRLIGTGFDWWVIADDDIEFARGSLEMLVHLADEGRLDLAQPAHTPDSAFTYAITRVHPLRWARETSFVEIGPMVAVHAGVSGEVFPLREDVPMGWGSDVEWLQLSRAGALRLGVVDAVVVRHLEPVARDYSREGALRERARVLDEHGIRDVRELQRTIRSWYFWQTEPFGR